MISQVKYSQQCSSTWTRRSEKCYKLKSTIIDVRKYKDFTVFMYILEVDLRGFFFSRLGILLYTSCVQGLYPFVLN
jgi:hypothetical protein